MQTISADFDPDQHEAITEIPAPNDAMKGKVIDEVQKGYLMNDKIIAGLPKWLLENKQAAQLNIKQTRCRLKEIITKY